MKRMLSRKDWRMGLWSVTIALIAALVAPALLVAQTAQAGSFSVLHAFGGGGDGANPVAALVEDGAGNLYGTTYIGGGSGCGGSGCGTVFKVDANGTESVLYRFQGMTNGANPAARLVRDAVGNLYGTTYLGGGSGCGGAGCGIVFKVHANGTEVVLHRFQGKDGANPAAGLVRDAVGNFYGTTTAGGAGLDALGTVFKLDTTGKETVLHSFTRSSHLGGATPYSDLIRDAAGNLYGTTVNGGYINCGFLGPGYCGLVFKLDASGNETVLYRFAGHTGDRPYAGIGRDLRGNLYGTTLLGGNFSHSCSGLGCGVVFKLTVAGNFMVLHKFMGTDGGNSYAGLVQDAAGTLYGTTAQGGDTACNSPYGCGTVFQVDSSGKETVLRSFTGKDGANPHAGLVRDAAGNIYGTTQFGGPSNLGVVFKLTP